MEVTAAGWRYQSPAQGEEPRWRPGRSLDPSAPSPATPRYPSRRPPQRPGSDGRDGGVAGGDRGIQLVLRALPGPRARRVWDSSVRVGCSARRGELRLQPRSHSHRARPLPTSPPARDWESRGGASGGGLCSLSCCAPRDTDSKSWGAILDLGGWQE
ncbi:hypothetical protein NDU88_003011 [Pleurodeles waltl]|uniref:Uncharacterized protein n=1 Tax=Pleurodeles waltl TaxID=8319 RepID=A0AAV7UBB9_PLEWA|nr:hypothetical protein NDU88_003011 [Pleurodeles waltl]